MMKKYLGYISMVATLAFATPSVAAPLVVGSGWKTFTFGDVGSAWSTSFEVDIAAPAKLTVTDAFLSGDRFEVFANGVSLGLTSLPTKDGEQISANYDLAAASPVWSTGVFALLPGSYTITGLTVLSPFATGGAALRLDASTVVPLPPAFLLLGAGLAGLGLVRRRARRG